MFGAPSVVNVVINIVSHAARGLWPLRSTQLAAFGRYSYCTTNHVVGRASGCVGFAGCFVALPIAQEAERDEELGRGSPTPFLILSGTRESIIVLYCKLEF